MASDSIGAETRGREDGSWQAQQQTSARARYVSRATVLAVGVACSVPVLLGARATGEHKRGWGTSAGKRTEEATVRRGPLRQSDHLERYMHTGHPLLLQPTPGVATGRAAGEGHCGTQGDGGGLPPQLRGAHRPQLAHRSPVELERGTRGARPSQRPLGSHHDPAGPRTPLQLLRPDPSRAICASPSIASRGAFHGAPHRHRLRRARHVDLVCEPVRRRRPCRCRRPGPRGGREHSVREELRWVDQLLEPIQRGACATTAYKRFEGVRVAVRIRHQPRW